MLKALESIKMIPTDLYFDTKYIKYRRLIELQLNAVTPPISLVEARNRLDEICTKFTPVFGIEPTYYFGKSDFRQKVYLLITAPDGYTIFNAWPLLMEAIIKTVFVELQEGTKE